MIEDSQQKTYTAFAIHPTLHDHFYIGTQEGEVYHLKPSHNKIDQAEIIFKGTKPIDHLSFSPDGNFMGISNGESSAIVYSAKSNKLFKIPYEH